MFKWLGSFFFDEEIDEDAGDKTTSDSIVKLTDDFINWAESDDADDPSLCWETEENLLCRYVIKKRKSPYKGDEDFKKAKALLKRNYIDSFNFNQ